jgi:hypothetical protein
MHVFNNKFNLRKNKLSLKIEKNMQAINIENFGKVKYQNYLKSIRYSRKSFKSFTYCFL